VYEFCFEDGEGYAKTYCPSLDCPEQFLSSANVTSKGKGRGSHGEIVYVGTHQASRDPEMEGCNLDKEKQEGRWGSPEEHQH